MIPQAEANLLIAEGIRSGQYPARLYKYRAFDEYTDSLFINHQLYFSKPSGFNDPFDCQIRDLFRYTRDEVYQYLITRAGAEPEQAGQLADMYSRDPSVFNTALEAVKQSVIGSKGILSMTVRRDDILMWAHYTHSHEGFVLGFDIAADIQFFTTPHHVTYVDEYPAFAFLTEREKIVSHGMLAKSSHWSYEEEIRVIKNEDGLKPFEKRSLVEVIMGSRISAVNRARLEGLLQNHGYDHVEIKQATVSSSRYALEIP